MITDSKLATTPCCALKGEGGGVGGEERGVEG